MDEFKILQRAVIDAEMRRLAVLTSLRNIAVLLESCAPADVEHARDIALETIDFLKEGK